MVPPSRVIGTQRKVISSSRCPAGRRAVEEARLPAHSRHHGRRPRLGDHPGDPLAHAVANPSRGPGIAERGLDHEEAALFLQQRDGAAQRPAAALEDLEHAVEARLEVQGSGERLAHLHQHGELAAVRPALALGDVVAGPVDELRIGGADDRRPRGVREERGDVEDDLSGDAHQDHSTIGGVRSVTTGEQKLQYWIVTNAEYGAIKWKCS